MVPSLKSPLPLCGKVKTGKVNLSLVFERQGREQYGSQLNTSLAFIRQGRGQKGEPLPGLYMSKSRVSWFERRRLPCPYAPRSRTTSKPFSYQSRVRANITPTSMCQRSKKDKIKHMVKKCATKVRTINKALLVKLIQDKQDSQQQTQEIN